MTIEELQSHFPGPRLKGPRVEIELFEYAEAYLQTELVPGDQAALLEEYHASLLHYRFGQALDLLVQLGEQQQCTIPFWRVLAKLTKSVWPTEWIVDRREKGKLETRIARIKRRARGNT